MKKLFYQALGLKHFLCKPFYILIFISQIGFSQNLVINGDFGAGLSDWNTSLSPCPTANTPAWAYYTSNLVPGYPYLWDGSAFLNNKIANAAGEPMVLSQTIYGLLPAQGNKVNIKMDVILAEAYNQNINGQPAEYMSDYLRIEVWLGGTKYASITTPTGWYSTFGNEFAGGYVDYFNGATSVNYSSNNAFKNIAPAFVSGDFPSFSPVKNSDWDIAIPWECNKTSTANFEIKVFTDLYLGKSITDTRNQNYAQTCTLNNFSNLDEVAVDNIVIENSMIVNTPPLNNPNLSSTTCGQTYFDLTLATSSLPICPLADENSVEYQFFKDVNLTQPIGNPFQYQPLSNIEKVYVVLASKVTLPSLRKYSSVVREIKITKNVIENAGSIGNEYEMCSNAVATELVNLIEPSLVEGTSLSYFWEQSIGNIAGPYTAAAGENTQMNYMPAALTTSNEFVTNYYFRRSARSTLNGLTCLLSTPPVNIIVRPCAPISDNNSIEFFFNPGGTQTVTLPNTLFSATPVEGEIKQIKINKFPTKTTSFTITASTPSGRVLAGTTYCANPPADGCVGTSFPTNGIILPANTAGNLINYDITLDPFDGSVLVVVPYKTIDTRGFLSTEAESSVLFGAGQPLSVKLKSFEVQKNNDTEIELAWQSEKETNFSHFEVEVASGNLHFEKKATILPNEQKVYRESFASLSNGIWYFRLKMINTDGSFEYSSIRSYLQSNKTESKVKILKNPTNDNIKLLIHLEKGNYQINILDMLGRRVFNENKLLENNIGEYTLNHAPLKSGTYILQINNDQNKMIASQKLVVE